MEKTQLDLGLGHLRLREAKVRRDFLLLQTMQMCLLSLGGPKIFVGSEEVGSETILAPQSTRSF